MSGINKKIVYGIGIISILIIAVLFKWHSGNKYEKQIKLQEDMALEKIIKEVNDYSIISGKSIEEDGIKYTFDLKKGVNLDIESGALQMKEVSKGDQKEIIYSDSKGNEKLILEINYFTPPKLAILIDDVGMNTKTTTYFKKIDKPLSFATIPYLPKTNQATKILKDAGFEVILHMPMEGSNDILNRRTVGLIKPSMTEKEIYDKFDGAIENLGAVKGFNNHMGSRFTNDPEKMRSLLSYVKKKEMFFIDSNTNSKREGYKIAKELDIPTYYTSYFIDNSHKKEDIMEAIKVSVRLAVERDKVLVIGHYRKETAEAIYEMLDYIEDEGVELVSISEVLE
ncbi:divergent polysaccharide deacetylase family protein [Psychrilyobacter atlanticus]|uniref:divergent polysaccharide deacetylase family protein n=1 Tax=Psychrilyobacter atlanticus TaxID=271091 RepID=UPI0012EB1312|nr:divergent polysaccharide deacetylase family protein [Psychrilyobacter atlanticus]